MNRIKKLIYYNVIPTIGRVLVCRNKYVNVIYYHDIVRDNGYSYMRTNVDVFKRQMEYIISQGYETLRFDDLDDPQKMKYKKKRVLIAFDDGWRSNYSEIFDFMRANGLRYNIFLAIGRIDNGPNNLTWDMVRQMHQSGVCGFGTHTYNHVDASHLTEQSFVEEINRADEVFKRELGFTPKDFCFPYGKYSEESLIELEKNSGYERLYTSNMVYSYRQNGKFVMGRNGISNDDSNITFKNKLNGYFNVYKSIIK